MCCARVIRYIQISESSRLHGYQKAGTWELLIICMDQAILGSQCTNSKLVQEGTYSFYSVIHVRFHTRKLNMHETSLPRWQVEFMAPSERSALLEE
jgi:hypothetical protein